MKEAQLHQAFSAWLNKHELPYIHSRTDRRTSTALGDPDYLVAFMGHCLFLELKVGKNKLSPVQEKRIAYIRKSGNKVAICYTLEACIEAVLNILCSGKPPEPSERDTGHSGAFNGVFKPDFNKIRNAVEATGKPKLKQGRVKKQPDLPLPGDANRLYLKRWNNVQWVCERAEHGPDLLLHPATPIDIRSLGEE